MACSDDSFVDKFNGLRRASVHSSMVDVSCTKIYHAMNILWGVGDDIDELCESLYGGAGSNAMHSGDISQILLHEDQNDEVQQTTTGKRKFTAEDTDPSHETVCKNIAKSQRTEPKPHAKPPTGQAKQLSKETSFNIFNTMKAYRTPCGVYDHTTSNKLIH